MHVKGIFEIAIRVRDLEHSGSFYKDVIGFQHGLLDAKRHWLFLWVNGRAGMVVLQEDKISWLQQHFAFVVAAGDLLSVKRNLEEHGLSVLGPVELSWMNAHSIYCSDPDGHDLEFCALDKS